MTAKEFRRANIDKLRELSHFEFAEAYAAYKAEVYEKALNKIVKLTTKTKDSKCGHGFICKIAERALK